MMSLDKHIAALATKHAEIDANIAHEASRPNPDTLRLQRLKRKKLRLKEEISRYRNMH